MSLIRRVRTLNPWMPCWRVVLWLAIVSLGSMVAHGQSPALAELLHREFVAKDFAVKSFGPVRWLNGGASYATVEPSAKTEGARELVRYDTASADREVLVSALQFTPPGGDKPLAVEEYT